VVVGMDVLVEIEELWSVLCGSLVDISNSRLADF
jgi:hypothetical protein